jgi:hypothetical protein
MSQVKGLYHQRLLKDIADPDLANDRDEDRNKLIHKIIIRYVLKTIRLLIVLMFITFYVGISCSIIF